MSATLLHRMRSPATLPPFTEKELAKKSVEFAAQSGQINLPAQAVLEPIALSHPVRLAVGGLGLTNNDQNQQLGDLVTVQLTGTPGFELVERQKLAAILQELNLSLNRFVRAKDAVRAGKLLRADWFLLGTAAKIDGTNSLVVRVVDAHTGIMRDAGVFPADQPPTELAADLAGFLRQSRQDAASAKLRVYLAVGAFEDLSVNNRRADFPAQLSGYLTAAYRGSRVTLLERDYVETLLQEVRLDLAGLTEGNGTNLPVAMQSAFWLVSGQYQSYETTNLQVEVNLEVQRIFGKAKHFTIRGLPGEPIDQQIKRVVDNVMTKNGGMVIPTRVSEIRAQLALGKELADLGMFGLILPDSYQNLDEQEAARQRRNAQEAIAAFETVLLLDPGNREAKLYLAACLKKQLIGRPDEARGYYEAVLEEPVQDKWVEPARQALVNSFVWASPEEKFRWFSMAVARNTNPAIAEFYKQQMQSSQADVIIEKGDAPKAEQLAESRLFEEIAADFQFMQTGDGHSGGDFGMSDFVESFGTNQSAAVSRLAELYPKMETKFPELAPQLLESVVSYQTDTNSPLVGEVDRSLDWQIAHPKEVYKSKHLVIGSPIFQWCMKKKLYSLAVKAMDRNLSVDGEQSSTQSDDQDKIALGYAYIGVQRWKNAIEIFESYSNRPVLMLSEGPWGNAWTAVLTSKLNDYCRDKSGLPVVRDPHEFDMGKPLICLCSPSTFSVDEKCLWIGIGGQLLQLDFDLKTNLIINLPMDASKQITSICLNENYIWIGTDGAGLIEFEKNSHKCRHYSVEDGMMMNRVSCMHLSNEVLWIGYGVKNAVLRENVNEPGNGGLGSMDLASHKFRSFSPSMSEGTETLKNTSGSIVRESTSNPTRRAIQAAISGPDGNVWFITGNHPLRFYRRDKNIWGGVPSTWGSCLATDGHNLFVGKARNLFGKSQAGSLGVSILNFKDDKWRDLSGADGLPSTSVTTLTSHASQIWVGGMGYIALVDPVQDKVLHFAYVKAESVDRIQIAGGYMWAQFDWHLYRVPLSALQ
jgi:tetratricopeptide (TPR) repeat protein